jgi:hypothetical protein
MPGTAEMVSDSSDCLFVRHDNVSSPLTARLQRGALILVLKLGVIVIVYNDPFQKYCTNNVWGCSSRYSDTRVGMHSQKIISEIQ